MPSDVDGTLTGMLSAGAGTPAPDRLPVWSMVLRGVGGALLLAPAAVWTARDRYVLVLGGDVVPPWLVVAGLIALGLTVLIADHLLTDPVARAARVARRRPRLPPVGFGPLLAIGLALGVVVVGAAALREVDGGYVTLRPAGPGGCTLVVRETSFLSTGSAQVYRLGRGDLLGPRVASYESEDGGSPFRDRDYELVWTGRAADIRVLGAADELVPLPVDRPTCP